MMSYGISWLTRCLIVVLVVILVIPERSSSEEITPEQIASAATQARNKLNPLSLAATALVDHAIDKGNDALAQRLVQLNGIIQSAIFNLNQILKERVQDLDQKVRVQRMEAIAELDRLSGNVANVLKTSVDQLDTVLSQNMTGFQNALANSFASLPIPTEPLVNVGRENGMTVIANANAPTKLVITGSGLFKNGTQPKAIIRDGPNDKRGTRLTVETASMGLLTVALPPTVIPTTGMPKTYILSLGLSKGLLSKTVWPSFPLTICKALPRYTVRAKLTATGGASWERTVSGQQWFYIDTGSYVIRASMLASPPWQVDIDRPGFHSGLDIVWNPPTSPGGVGGGHGEGWSAANDAFVLTAGGSGGNSHAFARAALKKVTEVGVCGLSQQQKSLVYNDLNQLTLDKTVALVGCDVSLKTPQVVVVVEIMQAGKVIEAVNLPVPRSDEKALNGLMTLSVDSQGLLNINLRPSCRQKVEYSVEP
jgi:hypothetical protein